MQKERSIGVIIFGVFAIGIGFFDLLYAEPRLINLLKIHNLLININPALFTILSKEFYLYCVISTPIIGGLSISAGIGILKLKSWGKNIFIGLALYNLLGKIVLLSLGITQKTTAGKPLTVALFFVLNGYIIYFFTRQKIKEQFKQHQVQAIENVEN